MARSGISGRASWKLTGGMVPSATSGQSLGCSKAIVVVVGLLTLVLCFSGCTAPANRSQTAQPIAHDQPSRLLQNIDLPRRIGVVENIGLQTPVISPDGRQMLYLRSDQPQQPPTTLVGADTPAEGTLSIWLRPTVGAMPGRRISPHRWSHSPVWSDSGRAIAYVANEESATAIIHLDLSTNQQTQLGLPHAVNAMPRFDGDDHTLLFCAGDSPYGPWRIYRQAAADPEPIALSTDGADCLLPVMTGLAGKVLCAAAESDRLNWTWSAPSGASNVGTPWGQSSRLEAVQTWAAIACPLSPDRDGVMFYDIARDRICVLHLGDSVVRQHRSGTIAGCWLDNRTIALATQGGLFITDTKTGASTPLLNGPWIPCRYVPRESRLILLGQQGPQHFAVWQIADKPPAEPTTHKQSSRR